MFVCVDKITLLPSSFRRKLAVPVMALSMSQIDLLVNCLNELETPDLRLEISHTS